MSIFQERCRATASSSSRRTVNSSPTSGIAAFDFDEDAREIYIPDGFLNKRVLVYDMDTGAFKRGWGGHGLPLSEIDNDPTLPYDVSGLPPDIKGFAILHC